MEPYLLAGLVLLFVAYSLQGRRFDAERLRHAEELKTERTELSLLHVAHREQTNKLFEAYRDDIAQLCQRIQAPELAVIEHEQRHIPDQSSMPLTDEQIAEQQEQAALIARMEQIANEGLVA